MTKKKLPPKYQEWIDARKAHKLSHAHIAMARELGMTPKSLRKLNSGRHHAWKLPLPQYLAECYEKRFGKTRPDEVLTIEQIAAEKKKRELERKAQKQAKKAELAETSEAQPQLEDPEPKEIPIEKTEVASKPSKPKASTDPRYHPILYTKAEKRKMRHLGGLLYTRNLDAALGRLRERFEAWHDGDIDGFELSEDIHHFYTGPSRELYKRFAHASTSCIENEIARGLYEEVLPWEEIPEEMVPRFEALVEGLRRWDEEEIPF